MKEKFHGSHGAGRGPVEKPTGGRAGGYRTSIVTGAGGTG
jgi:hypothetical protein